MEDAVPSTETEYNIREQLDQMRSQVQTLDEQLRSFVQRQPLAAVLSAALLGYGLARISSWR